MAHHTHLGHYRPGSSRDGDWCYLPLTSVMPREPFQGEGLVLYCSDEEGGSLKPVICTEQDREALRPFVQQLEAWRRNPIANEIPVVPVFQDRTGQSWFYSGHCPPPRNRFWLPHKTLLWQAISVNSLSSPQSCPVGVDLSRQPV